MNRTWQGLAVWSAFGILWAAAPLVATPPMQDVEEVEQWHGLKRVGNPPGAKPKAPSPAPGLDPTPLCRYPDAGFAKGCREPEKAGFVRPSPTATRPAEKPVVAPVRLGHVESIPAPSAPPAPGKETSRPLVQTQELHHVIASAPTNEGSIQAATNLASAILTPLAILAGFWIVGRYLKGRPLIRVEHMGGGLSVPFQLMAPSTPQPAAAQTASSKPVEETSTAEHFDLGPTYEDELRAREQQAADQEQGLLQQMFDDNLAMRKNLKESHDEWIQGSEPAQDAALAEPNSAAA